MSRFSTRNFISRLNHQKDARQIVYLVTCYDFPFDMARALELALFRTFASPSVSAVLDSTGEFDCRPQKRYDDTDIILNEMLEHGYDTPRGLTALRRMNQMHGHYNITNEDFLYVLSTFVCEPIRWIGRFGWRPLTENEKLAMFYYWQDLAHHMNIKNVFETLEEMEQYNVEYERIHFKYTESNARVAQAGRDMFLRWVPFFMRPGGKWAIYAMMDESLLRAFGFPRPPDWLRTVVERSLRMRARAVRLLPGRRNARLRTAFRHRSYPHGYQVSEVGSQPAYDSAFYKHRSPSQRRAAAGGDSSLPVVNAQGRH